MRRRGELAVLLGVVVLAGWLRLRALDLVEFKADEARALELANHVLEGAFPTTGLVSSVGALNPPLFPYLLALPAALDDDPLFVTGAIGVLAVLTVALTYAVLRPRFGALAALSAAALYATAPWAVLFGRKIWAQNLLPATALGLLWALFVVLERRRTRWVALIPIILCIALQLHFSAVALAAPAVIVLAYRAREIDWRALAAGAAIAVALLAPYLAHEARHGLEDIRLLVSEGRGSGEGVFPGAGSLEAVRETARIVGGAGWDYVTGASAADVRELAGAGWTLGRLASAFTAVALLAAVAWFSVSAFRRSRRAPGFPFVALAADRERRAVLAVWLVCAWASFAASTPNDVYPHYLIVAYPIAFATVGVFLSDLALAARSRAPQAALAVAGAVALVAAGYVTFTLGFQHAVERLGGTAGDYGVAYRHTSDLAAFAAARGLVFGEDEPALTYLARRHGRAEAGAMVTVRSTLRPGERVPCDGERRRFGPLEACVPARATR